MGGKRTRPGLKWKHIAFLFILQFLINRLMAGLLIPYIELSLDGLHVFGSAKGSYDLEYARRLLGALGGRPLQVYIYAQLPLSFIFAALHAAVYCMVLVKGFPRSYGLAYLLPLLYLAFAWGEGLCAYYLLMEGLSAKALSAAGFCTQAKVIMDYILPAAGIGAIIVSFFRFADGRFGWGKR